MTTLAWVRDAPFTDGELVHVAKGAVVELLDLAAEHERLITAITARHVEKRGESPRYHEAPQIWEPDRAPDYWEPYVICAHDGTTWPCATIRMLQEATTA